MKVEDEARVWDLYVAAGISAYDPPYHPEVTADAFLKARRERFGGATPDDDLLPEAIALLEEGEKGLFPSSFPGRVASCIARYREKKP